VSIRMTWLSGSIKRIPCDPSLPILLFPIDHSLGSFLVRGVGFEPTKAFATGS
jgi:hypothetical protein